MYRHQTLTQTPHPLSPSLHITSLPPCWLKLRFLVNFYKRISQSCAECSSVTPKRGLASHAPVNMADSMKEVNVVGNKNLAGYVTFAALYCAIFRTSSFRKSLKFFGTSIPSLDPETVELPALSIIWRIRHVYRCVARQKS